MPTTPENKTATVRELENAKKELEKALTRILDDSKPDPDDFELGRIASASRALLDINGVC